MRAHETFMVGPATVDLKDIGTLTRRAKYWRLRYQSCGHVQEFPRDRVLRDVRSAEQEVQRHYAQCLTCKAANALRRQV